jgi:hypothetical protein
MDLITYFIEKWIAKFKSENLKRRDHLRDPDIDKRIILKWNLKIRISPVANYCENGNECLCSIRDGEFF